MSSSTPSQIRRGIRLAILLAGAGAFWGLRVHYWNITTEPLYRDMQMFDLVARGILRSFDFSWDSFHQSYNPPTLATLRALQIFLLGDSVRAWQWFQAAFVFCGLCWMCCEVFRETRSFALASALLWVVALCRPSVFWSLKLAREGLAEGFAYWCVAASILAFRSRHWLYFLLLGGICGAAFLNRVNSFVVVPLLAAAVVVHSVRRRDIRRGALLLVAFVVGVVLIWGPWLSRSYRLYRGSLVPFSTQPVFFWEMGPFTVRLADGTELRTSQGELAEQAPTRFRNDLDAARYYNSLIRPWLRDNWNWYVNFVLFNRIGRSIRQRDEYLTLVPRERLFGSGLETVLLDKSMLLVVSGVAGLLFFAFTRPALGGSCLVVAVAPWLSSMIVLGYPRMLDPSLPLILFGNWLLLAAGVSLGRERLLKHDLAARLASWATGDRTRLLGVLLALNLALTSGATGLLLIISRDVQRTTTVITETSGDWLVIRSLTGTNYVFGVRDGDSEVDADFRRGRLEGRARVYEHPDQHADVVMLEPGGRYRLRLEAARLLRLRFFGDSSSGVVRVVWRGEYRDVDLHSGAAGGEWRELWIP
jgi:hypothetical protein